MPLPFFEKLAFATKKLAFATKKLAFATIP